MIDIRGDCLPKFWCFFETSLKGEVIFDPKNYTADFLISEQYILVVNFGEQIF